MPRKGRTKRKKQPWLYNETRRNFALGDLFLTITKMLARYDNKKKKNQYTIVRNPQVSREKSVRELQKEEKARYLSERLQEVDELNRGLETRVSVLSNILDNVLGFDATISFDKLRIKDNFPQLVLPDDLKTDFDVISKEEFLSRTLKTTLVKRLIPGWKSRHQKKAEKAEQSYKEYKDQYELAVMEQSKKIDHYTEEYKKEKKAFERMLRRRNQEIDELEKNYKKGDPSKVAEYCSRVLERSDYPDNFPKKFRTGYVPEPRELIVEYELPTKNIVPTVAEYRYIKTRDSIEEKARKPAEIKDIYQDIFASICLRSIHELFSSDQGDHLEVIVFNGYVQTIDPATGQDIRPCLISIRTTREKFLEIKLAKVEKRACLRNLGAQVSPRPDELLAVKPILEFNMVDKRFIDESDVISSLDTRPNLMDLDPFEFEELVNNLFSKMGFEAKLTRSSRDGGIDVVAFDLRPILGGKVVIQAKRYKNVVGVSAVRDLYGSMINEGASKGILVTTSHYGADAYDFASNKPIELIDGGRLLYLLEENGYKANIIFPQDG